jgi:hypothetical protein
VDGHYRAVLLREAANHGKRMVGVMTLDAILKPIFFEFSTSIAVDNEHNVNNPKIRGEYLGAYIKL